jgi:hypothetical protein
VRFGENEAEWLTLVDAYPTIDVNFYIFTATVMNLSSLTQTAIQAIFEHGFDG